MFIKRHFFKLASVSILTVHALHVEYTNRLPPEALEFSPGSGDDITRDAIHTGDIMLFRRKWYNYHLPAAIMIKLYQKIYNTEFDHAGVILINDHGIPFVYEKTPFGGYKCRSFQSRVLRSKSSVIVLLLLDPRLEMSEAQKSHNKQEITNQIVQEKGWKSSELYAFVTCTFQFMMSRIFPSSYSLEQRSSKVCMNAQFILDTFRKLSISPAPNVSTERLTINHFVTHSVSFEGTVNKYAPVVSVENVGATTNTTNFHQAVSSEANKVFSGSNQIIETRPKEAVVEKSADKQQTGGNSRHNKVHSTEIIGQTKLPMHFCEEDIPVRYR